MPPAGNTGAQNTKSLFFLHFMPVSGREVFFFAFRMRLWWVFLCVDRKQMLFLQWKQWETEVVKGGFGVSVYLTPDEVAERCRVTRRTVYDWLREGKLRGRRAGRKWLVSDEDIDRFLDPGAGPVAAELAAPVVDSSAALGAVQKSPARGKSGKPRRR